MRFSPLRLSAFALLAVVPSLFAADRPTATPKGQRIFIAGHSFHIPIVSPLGQIAKSAGIDQTLAGTQSIGGSTTTQHWERADEMNTAKQAIKAGKVDVLTLSPHHKLMPDPAIDKFVDLVLENNPQGRVLLQASWMLSDGQSKGFTTASRDTADPAELRKTWESLYYVPLRKQVKSINDAHAQKLRRPVVLIVPAGEALLRLRERVAKGEVPGIAKQSDLYRDASGHGGPPMGVLTAYCHFAVIYGRSPVGLPVPDTLKAANLGENTAKVNRILQECAWESVASEPASGVKSMRAK
jgi:hypothetical protein